MSGALFGSPGKMIEFFPWEDKQSVEHDRSLKIHETIGGGSFAFRGPKTRRTWSLKNDDLTPEEYRDLELLLYDSQGLGPFWLIDQEARVTNALTPAQTLQGVKGVLTDLSGDVSPAGTIPLPGGFNSPAVVSTGDTAAFRFDIPVFPGVPTTFSVYGSGGGTVRAQYLLPSGEFGGNAAVLTPENTSELTRYVATVVPPQHVSAAYMSFGLSGFIAAPAVTYTPNVQPWAVGKGCNQAVLSSWNSSYDRMSTFDHDRRMVSVSLKVEEVGAGA